MEIIKGELLPMLGLPDDRVILSSELPFLAFTEQDRGRCTAEPADALSSFA